MIQKLKKSNEGFTLVELIVVIAILGILAAVLVPQYTQYIEKSRQKTDFATLEEIRHAATLEASSAEVFPSAVTTVTVAASGITFGGTSATVLDDVIPGGTPLKSTKSYATYTLTYNSTTKSAEWSAADTVGAGHSSTLVEALKNGAA